MTSTRQPTVGGIILAGVRLWGESPLERIGPRPLLPVAGRPLAWYGLDWLRQAGIRHVTVCANSHTSALRSWLGNGGALDMSVDYYEDLMPRGPAGCVRDAVMEASEDFFVVVEGALLPRVDLRALLKQHVESGSVLTIAAIEQGPLPSGGAQLRPAGIYVFSRSALEQVPERGYQDIKEVLVPRLHQHGDRVVPFMIDAEDVIAVTGLGSYLRAAISTLEHVAAHNGWSRDYRRMGNVWVHKTARVSESVRLSEPILVGPRAWIEPKVVILGHTIVGPESRIGTGAILSDVVSWPGCEVGAGAILNRCILLAGSTIETGLVVRDSVCCGIHEGGAEPAWGTTTDYWAMEPRSEPSVAVSRPAPVAQAPAGHRPAAAAAPNPLSTSAPMSDISLSPSPA